ncbi:hypothetical protein FQN50_005760 [Emmonsiellopsis sp. PD_5]|nr:hypothetical protein FQN50_005760 [Emmonsiellopsis sp. PD_5]
MTSPAPQDRSNLHNNPPNTTATAAHEPQDPATTTTTTALTGQARDYYSNITARPRLWEAFRNLDDNAQFRACMDELVEEGTRNFMVDFGKDEAYAGFDLEREDFAALLGSGRPKSLETRWINIWAPEKQRELVQTYVLTRLQTVTGNYGISARLQSMMVSNPDTPSSSSSSQAVPAAEPRLTSDGLRNEPEAEPDEKTGVVIPGDVESGLHPGIRRAETAVSMIEGPGLGQITFSQIANKIWHFASVDYGQKYLCVGYNSLHVVSGVDFQNGPSRPEGKRVWTWLIVCDDGTVISIHENPFPPSTELPADKRQKALKVIRQNTTLVFSGISSLHIGSEHSNPLMTTYVRNFPNQTGTAAVKPGDGPGLLFYYLFDNWTANYSLVIRREHSYSAALERLRKRMLERAQVELIDDLHRLGRQLAVLKRIYQSYELVVNRILKRQRLLREESRGANNNNNNHHHQVHHSHGSGTFGFDFLSRNDTMQSGSFDDMNPNDLGGVQLSSAATGRFERLADRIRLYALSEIEECLTEKESLTFLVFNLIALKDSQAVERLTRTTILLAKATILFLPVSLMTGYFSTQIKELEGVYTVKQYWVAFAVIMVISALVLALYGRATDTVEGKTIYRSIGKTFYQASRAAIGKRKRKVG